MLVTTEITINKFLILLVVEWKRKAKIYISCFIFFELEKKN